MKSATVIKSIAPVMLAEPRWVVQERQAAIQKIGEEFRRDARDALKACQQQQQCRETNGVHRDGQKYIQCR